MTASTALARYRKLVVALLGAVAVAVSQGLVPDTVARWVPVVIAFTTALGVYAVPNDPPAVPAEDLEPVKPRRSRSG